MNFTPTQQQNLLSKMGYDGPADSKMMEAFIASNPGAAAKMGKFSRAMQKRTGMAPGGDVSPPEDFNVFEAMFPNSYTVQPVTVKGADGTSTVRYQSVGPGQTSNYDSNYPTGMTFEQALQRSNELNTKNNLPQVDYSASTSDPVQDTREYNVKSHGDYWTLQLGNDSIPGFGGKVFKDEAAANAAIEKIKSGASGADVLKEYSTPTVTQVGDYYTLQDPTGFQSGQFSSAEEANKYKAASDAGETGNFNVTLGTDDSGSAVGEYTTTATTPTGNTATTTNVGVEGGGATSSTVGQDGEALTFDTQPATVADGSILDSEAAKNKLAKLTEKRARAAQAAAAAPDDESLQLALQNVEKEYAEAQTNLNVAQTQFGIENVPTGGETVGKIFGDPTSMVEKATVDKVGAATPEELIDAATGKVDEVRAADTSTVDTTATAAAPEAMTATTYDATKSVDDVRTQAEGTKAATGEVTQLVTPQTMNTEELAQLGLTAPQIEEIRQVLDTGDLQVTPDQLAEAATLANQGIPLPQAIAQTTNLPADVVAAKFTTPTPDAEAVVDYDVPPTKSAELLATEIEDAAKAGEIPTAEEKVSTFESTVDAAQGKVGAEELVEAKDIVKVAETIEATAATMDALNEASVAQAVNGTLSQAALATAEQGSVPASATISGQMAILMEQFNDGTPAWAAGAMRAANAAMGARGLGASSMAGAAIVQASMEAAMPIAQADAQMFMQMELTNLDNRQQVALSNAAAQRDMELANLSNEQQVALQNSANAFALQSQNLSNSQAAVIANAQIKASLQGKVLDIYTQTSLANAARYAEINNINLNNEQQTLLTKSAQNLQVDLANLDSTQQTALANLQVRASIRGQELTNEQQMAMLESTQNFQAAEFNASAKQQAFIQDAAATLAMQGKVLDNQQQTELFNISNIVQERNLELTSEQQTRIFNATNRTNVDLANLSSRQQTALANAQIDAALRGQELTNAQQTGIVNAARIGEVANINFTADQQRAIENSKLAQSVDLANLNSSSAKLLSDAAAMSNLDMTNLNNRQQAQVQNAQNLLQMDLTNLSNEQQTSIFASQSIINSMLSDQAAENAAEQFNAASENQVTQFFADLEANIARFNADQSNAMAQFNAGEENANERFNTQLEAARDQFNAANGLIIAQANAKWRQTITLTDTEAQNEANREEAATANAMTAKALDDLWQRERDIMAFAFSASENKANREVDLLLGDQDLESVRLQLDAQEDAGKTRMYLWAADKVLGSDWSL